MRPNKLKRRSLEPRKVYCKAMQGDEVAHALKSLEVPEEFRQSIFKGQDGRGRSQGTRSACAQFSDCLVVRQQGGVTGANIISP